jgi:D-arabinose 5-phosphate isomerase GutQ
MIDKYILKSKQVLKNDINSLQNMYDSLDWKLVYKVAQVLANTESIFVSGVGKSGLISKKISSSFASI